MARTKREITETLISAIEGGYDIDFAMTSWWFNRRLNGGFRLTDLGSHILTSTLGLQHYDMKITAEDLDSKTLIALDRNIENPYYIMYAGRKPIWIIFFGSKDATMAYLYDNLKLFAKSSPGGRKRDNM